MDSMTALCLSGILPFKTKTNTVGGEREGCCCSEEIYLQKPSTIAMDYFQCTVFVQIGAKIMSI